jgi:DNA repair protein RadA/Sms
LRLLDKDVFVNVVGGIKFTDPSADAAIALAIASAHMNRPLMASTVVLGELGLLGEFRSVTQVQQRVVEAERLGFAHAVLPARTKVSGRGGMEVHACRRIDQGIELLR